MSWWKAVQTVVFGTIAVSLFIEGASSGLMFLDISHEYVWWAYEIANVTVYYMAALYALEQTPLFSFAGDSE